MSALGNTPLQTELFFVEKQVVLDDVELGVLSTGEPYLTGRGLARMCGIDHAVLHRLSSSWGDEQLKPRGKSIKQLLNEAKYVRPELFVKAKHNNVEIQAYPEAVCLAILEYYAFVVSEPRQQAINAFRYLARRQFREFVYEAVGYQPSKLDNWKQFHDRVSITYDSVPVGYFSMFKEIADMIVTIGQEGIYIDDSFVPDISVGMGWGKHWTDNNLQSKFGDRVKYEHHYPEYFPQAMSNPQQPWCYPEDSLGEFRKWFRDVYVGKDKMKKYLTKKVKDKELPDEFATKAIAAYERLLLPNKN